MHMVFVLISLTGYGQTVSIPDPAFLNFLKAHYPQTINTSDQLIVGVAAQVTGNISCPDLGIKNLEGIQYFSKVTKISAIHNDIVSLPSLLPMTNLETVHMYDNKLTAVPDFKGILKLKTVLLYENDLMQMPVFGNNPVIEEIIISKNNLTGISDLSGVPSLLKLDVGENQLTQLPDVSSNVNLQELICWSNQLTTLPALNKLKKLTRLNAGKNKLTQLPDLSANTELSILAFDNNQLTQMPDLSALNNLTSVKLYNNYFTFEDLMPYSSGSDFTSVYDYSPMLPIPGDTVNAYYNQSAEIHSNIDTALNNVTYKWYENNSSFATTAKDGVILSQPAGIGITERYVYVQVTHPSVPGLTLVTDTILVRYNPCPIAADITYTASKADCGTSGSLDIKVQGYVSPQTTYLLTSTSFGSSEYYTNRFIHGLADTAYQLQIEFSPACLVTYAPAIRMPYVDCKEVFMTPDGDGDMDTYFIPGSGSAVIYDKNGREVQKIKLPYEWNGYGPQGLVQAGYYIIVVNGGKDRVYISVLY